MKVKDIQLQSPGLDRGFDILAHFSLAGRPRTLVCEIKADGQPRHVRMTLLQLRDCIAHLKVDAIPFLIAPYLSPEAQALCREQGVGLLDFEGNYRLVFDAVFIECFVSSKPAAALAKAAGVSLGQVSNVRLALRDRERARVDAGGQSLTARFLRDLGHDVVRVAELGLSQAAAEELLRVSGTAGKDISHA